MASYQEITSLTEILVPATKDHILKNCYARLINKENLPSHITLEEIPYINYMDLAILYTVQFCELKNSKFYTKCYILTKKDMELYEFTERELKIAINANSSKNDLRIRTLKQDMIDSILSPLYTIENDIPATVDLKGLTKGSTRVPIKDSEIALKNAVVVSNRTRTFGASMMALYQEEISSYFHDKPFYIIPQSIHRLICLSEDKILSESSSPNDAKMQLLDILDYFNDSIENEDEILSYYLYYCDPSEKSIMKIK